MIRPTRRPQARPFRLGVEALEDRSVPATLNLVGTVLTFTLDPGATQAAMTGTATNLTFDAGSPNTITSNAAAQAIGFNSGAQTSGPGSLSTVTQLNIVGDTSGVETFNISTSGGTFPAFNVDSTVNTTVLNATQFDTGSNGQTYGGPVLENSSIGTALSGSTLTFASTVDGGFGLTTTFTATTFGGAVGSNTPLGSLSVTTTTLSAGSIATSSGVTVNLSGAGLITGAVSGTGATFTKTGAGTLSLTGTSTYGGSTNLDQGTLLVDGAISGTGLVNVVGTLGGTGTVAGSVIMGGGTSPAGRSAGSALSPSGR